MEIGFALHPASIEDVVRIYIRAVELILNDPQNAEARGEGTVAFWAEFATAGRA
jgi:hypothetical protein